MGTNRTAQKDIEVIRNTCRASGVVARYGGDEFVILLPETTERE